MTEFDVSYIRFRKAISCGVACFLSHTRDFTKRTIFDKFAEKNIWQLSAFNVSAIFYYIQGVSRTFLSSGACTSTTVNNIVNKVCVITT